MGAQVSLTILCALLLGCQGPDPEVVATKLSPDPQNARLQWVEVRVRNRSSGEGDAKLIVRLKSAHGSFQKTERVGLKSREETGVLVHLPGPGAGAEVEAEIRYPPD